MFFWKKKQGNSSTSNEKASRVRELLPLAAGLVLTAAAILLARHRIAAVEHDIRRNTAPVHIVVAAVPIPAGTPFSEQNLARKLIPASGTSARNVPADEFGLLIGATGKTDLAAGEPILFTDVEEPFDSDKFSQTIPAGRRAMTLDADLTASFAGLLRPGDRVDLLCTKGNGTPVPTWVRDLPVVAVDRHFGRPAPSEDAAEVTTITVSVTPEEGRRVAGAGDGKIRWFLRNPDDRQKPISQAYSRGKEIRWGIEIWKGGKRAPLHQHAPVGEIHEET